MIAHVLTQSQIENTDGTRFGACENCHRSYRLGYIVTKHLRNEQKKYTINGLKSFVCESCAENMRHEAITTFFCTSMWYHRTKCYDVVEENKHD